MIMPARNIKRWLTILASDGVSFKTGRKYRDRRMVILLWSIKGPFCYSSWQGRTSEGFALKETGATTMQVELFSIAVNIVKSEYVYRTN